ncbi:MAG: glycosyltransferase family 9 protein, partial [Gemmatimonadaceae bacterium]
GAPEERPRVAMVLSAGESAKEWSADRFAEVAAALEAVGTVPVLLPAPGDETKVAAFRARTVAGIIADARPVRSCMALMASCSAVLSADTGPAHMAMALGVPTVTIYGPRPPALWNPGRADTMALWAGDERCCHRNRCALDNACMAAVTVAQVLDALHALLARPAAQVAPLTCDPAHAVHRTEGVRHE